MLLYIAHSVRMNLKSEKNIILRPDSNFWRSVTSEEKVEELQTTQPSNYMILLAHFLAHTPRRSAIWRRRRSHFWLWILWVRASWSFPLKVEVPTGINSHIESKKLAPLLLFLSHKAIKKFSLRLLFTSKWKTSFFSDFEPSSRPNFRLFYNV